MSMLKCTRCGEENLFVETGYDGADYNSEHGERSGFNATVSLICPDCGMTYIIGRVRRASDFAIDIAANHFSRDGGEAKNFPKDLIRNAAKGEEK